MATLSVLIKKIFFSGLFGVHDELLTPDFKIADFVRTGICKNSEVL